MIDEKQIVDVLTGNNISIYKLLNMIKLTEETN